MNISARNQLKGKIVSIQEGTVNGMVALKTDGGDTFTSTISKEAVKELGLAPGKEAIAVIKATEVMIGLGEMKLSARNQLAGEIVNVQEGAVNAIVTVKTDGGSTLYATISMLGIKELGIAPGVKAKAVIKATSVMIAV
ncbi:TOBE domain-containing protein [Syntrophomonas wolfei]|uniref:TOBE domain-containing protein n=1 Tax=Syntrophomonas wolfei TaxID=863 RepID=UPI00077490F1|nr:TOBE domain-containing protein [Syntrophomonas wolfei]